MRTKYIFLINRCIAVTLTLAGLQIVNPRGKVWRQNKCGGEEALRYLIEGAKYWKERPERPVEAKLQGSEVHTEEFCHN